jgi:hypothetical protein
MTSVSISRGALVIAALVSASACGNGEATSPQACLSALSLSVGRGMQPSIDWQPACAVGSVWVAPVVNGPYVPVWEASATFSGVTPPVSVGSSPSGAIVWGAGISLTADTVYRLLVVRGARGDPVTRVDSLTFTAQP